jgi:RNA:NAD 2'-phosphotransferase (TPT1/KptA family)
VDEVNGQQNISPIGCHWEKKWNLGNYKGNQNRQKKRKKKTCEPNEQQNEQLEKLLKSMFKHNSLKLGLQLLFLGWMTTFTMIFKWVSKNIRIDTWGSI